MNSGLKILGCVALAVCGGFLPSNAQSLGRTATQTPAGAWVVPSAVDSEISETGLSGAELADYAVWLKTERATEPTMAKARNLGGAKSAQSEHGVRPFVPQRG